MGVLGVLRLWWVGAAGCSGWLRIARGCWKFVRGGNQGMRAKRPRDPGAFSDCGGYFRTGALAPAYSGDSLLYMSSIASA